MSSWLATSRWPEARLKDHVDLINGFPFDSSVFGPDGEVRLVRIRDLTDGGDLTYVHGEVPAAALIDTGDLVIGMDGDFNSVTWSGGRAALNQRLCVLRARNGLDQRYLSYIVPMPLKIINDLTYFTTVKHLSSTDLLSERIPFPPLDEQRAIADYLDRETARIDALIAAKERMRGLLGERLAADRISTVAGDRWAQRSGGPAWLGTVPSHWRVMRLKFLARMDSGHTPSRQIDAYWTDCTIPWVTLNDVGQLESEWRFYEPKNAINELGMANSAAHLLPQDAVLLSRDATVGRSALLGRPMAVSQHFVAWICGTELLPEYLLQVFRGPMQAHFGTLTAGATIGTIGMPELGQLVVPVPPMSEQREIVRELADVERWARNIANALGRQIRLLRERRQELITAGVAGQLDVPVTA